MTRQADHRGRLTAALWVAGIATFSGLYAPQGVLTSIASSVGVSEATSALIVSSATLGVAVGVIPWAVLSGRLGPAATLRIAALCAAATSVLTPFVNDFTLMLVIRFVQGAALAGIPAVTMALIFQVTTGGRARTLAGTYIAATTLGGLAGRLISGPVGSLFGWQIGVGSVGLLCALLFVALFLLLRPWSQNAPRDTLPENDSRTVRKRTRWDFSQIALWLSGGLLIGIVVAIYNFLPFRLELPPHSIPEVWLSSIFLAYLAGTVSARFSGVITTRWGSGRGLILSACAMIVGLGAMISNSVVVLIIGLVILTGGMFLGHAIASSFVALRAGSDGAARASAGYTIAYYAGSAILGWLVGYAWEAFQWAGVTMAVAALILIQLTLSLFIASRERG